ncbi:AF4/FMR2 family member 4 isoform X2 [Callorhinchus milii]|uniref:AF4/FMR2 family member 4 isoform X2 n=1 Tax=Callorhinchus milii TaxID=7868 RepID=UPI00045754A2|nr:AF4/FMR2 family member 4 isoform X2 [Callorhinchus milii]|eukprot:gi/632958586/ref/XP_007895126.1/ PREDICTED: AF4/FMR2 family member 1 isoform X2 [Callorhinchus milii]
MALYMQYRLYNEDRNLLRIRERERRNQEIHLDKEPFLENTPLFGEPYKTDKGDELSSRIQNMLGNYDEMKDLISNKSHQNLIGIPKGGVSVMSQEKNQRSFGPEKNNTLMQASVHSNNPCSMGPPTSVPAAGSCSSQNQKKTALVEQNIQSSSHNTKSSFHSRSQVKDSCHSGQESYRNHHGRNEQQTDTDNHAQDLSSQLQQFQPLLPLSSPILPLSPIPSLSPIHSSEFTNSKIPTSNNHNKDCPPTKSPQDLDLHSCDPESLSSGPNVPVPSQHSSQTFPSCLPSKPNMMQQKPTAYVRPMDGQDQIPSESPELKPTSEDYNSESYGNIAEMKACARAKLSKLKIPSQPTQETLSNEANCVEEILKEMTHSWPPPLTAIHTPSTAEPSKFPFPTKDIQQVPSGFVGHKKCETLPKTSSSQAANTTLEDDLQLSSSDDSDGDQVLEKTEPMSDSKSASSLSQNNCVLSKHSSVGLNNLSESDSSSGSDSESESSSSEGEGNETSRTTSPEPDPPPANKWQLDNWLNKVNQPTAPSENHSELLDSHSSQDSQRSETKENCEYIGSSREPRTIQEASRDTSNWHTSTPSNSGVQRQTVAKKQPKKPGKTVAFDENGGDLRAEAAPCTYGGKDQSSTEQHKVKLKEGQKSSGKKESKSLARISSERIKHKCPIQTAPKSREYVDTDSSCTGLGTDKEEPHPCSNLAPAAPVPLRQEPSENGTSVSKPAREVNRTNLHKSAGVAGKVTAPASEVKELNGIYLHKPASKVKEVTRINVSKPAIEAKEAIPTNLNKLATDVKIGNRTSSSKATASEVGKGNRSRSNKSVCEVKDNLLGGPIFPTVGDGKLLSPIRDHEVPWPLVVKIDLSLLSRIPSLPGKASHQSKNSTMECTAQKSREGVKGSTEKSSSKAKRKHKIDGEECSEGKKQRLDKENKLCSSGSKEPSNKRVSNSSSEKEKKPFLPPPPSPVQKPAKVAHKRHNSGSSTSSQVSASSASDTKINNSKSNSLSRSSSSKHKRMEDKRSGHLKTKVSSQCKASNALPEQALPNGNSKPARPILKFDDKQYPVEHHLREAKKIKHKADVMADKIGKAFNYLDAALSFIESGIAMEHEAQPPKSAYTMFSETVDLIKYTMKLKKFTDSSATTIEKIFVVLCIRCQSLLYMAMFRFKKDTAVKYSRTLTEHFKGSSRTAQAPSPCVASTGTPSPLSQTPSPASSAGSQPGSNVSSGASTSSVAIPQTIHQLASTYVNITSLFLCGHDLWEQADALAKKHREFFLQLDAAVGPLVMTSSMAELVHCTRQGLHWLRMDAKLL